MAEPIKIQGYLDFLLFGGKYYYVHDLELRNLIDAAGIDTEFGVYEENVFPTFALNTFYEKVYELLTEQPADWSTNYKSYYILVSGDYVPNTNSTFALDTYYMETASYILLTEQPADWVEKYSKYYFLNKSGISSNRETLSTSYVIFNALSKKLDITTFDQFKEAYDYFVEHIQEYIDIEDETKLDKVTFEEFLQEFYTFAESFHEVAFTGSFNDLEDVPPGLGVRVEGTDLVFSGPSYGGMTAEEDENLADLIGSGVL